MQDELPPTGSASTDESAQPGSAQTRRAFLGSMAAAAVASLVPAWAGCAAPRHGTSPQRPWGVQLYTLRGALREDLGSTIRRVAETGYREVEFAGYAGRDPQSVRAALELNGLSAPAAHLSLEELETRWEPTLAAARIVGHRWLVVPWLAPDLRRTPADVERLARRFSVLGRRAADEGVRIAYHNHDYSVAPFHGSSILEMLVDHTDPSVMDFELDVFWAVKGGSDPIALLRRHAGRFPLLHLKDSAGPPEHRMVDVGAGSIDWREVIGAAATGGSRHFFVEHDDPADPFASIAASFQHLSSIPDQGHR